MQYDGLKERKLGPLSLGLHTGRNLGSSGRGAVTCTETGLGHLLFLTAQWKDGKTNSFFSIGPSHSLKKVKKFEKNIEYFPGSLKYDWFKAKKTGTVKLGNKELFGCPKMVP